MHKVGIGIINYNRSELLAELIPSLKNSINSDSEMIVCDDGSHDDSLNLCDRLGIRHIGSKNMGIAWNKNRAIYYLMNHSKCDQIILIENDCIIEEADWLKKWSAAVDKWGHVNCLHPSTLKKLKAGEPCSEVLTGLGTPDDPYLCTKISGICIGSRRDAIEKVGYLDTRFKGYGHEHSEWTLRFRRVGLGFRNIETTQGPVRCNIMISGGIGGADVPSSSDKSRVDENRKVLDECKADTTYRNPFRNEQERDLLLAEVSAALD